MKLNTAQEIVLAITDRGDMFEDYKAPHAYRGTPSKPRRRPSTILLRRLFKGHRP